MDDKKKRHQKVTKFLEFVHYDWGSDPEEKGTEEWKTYKEVHGYWERD